MKKEITILTAVFLIFITACTPSTNTENSKNQPPTPPKQEINTYSLDEVSQHDNENDCWLAIHGKVYDVTSFISSHPGGSAILEGCGKDASNLYETRPMGSGTPHSQGARNMLDNYYIGDLI